MSLSLIHEKLTNGLFLNINNSTDVKIANLRRLFELYGIDENELLFVLHPLKEELVILFIRRDSAQLPSGC